MFVYRDGLKWQNIYLSAEIQYTDSFLYKLSLISDIYDNSDSVNNIDDRECAWLCFISTVNSENQQDMIDTLRRMRLEYRHDEFCGAIYMLKGSILTGV